jgi:hypothetical protein
MFNVNKNKLYLLTNQKFYWIGYAVVLSNLETYLLEVCLTPLQRKFIFIQKLRFEIQLACSHPSIHNERESKKVTFLLSIFF